MDNKYLSWAAAGEGYQPTARAGAEICKPPRHDRRRDRNRQNGDVANSGWRDSLKLASRCFLSDVKGDLSGLGFARKRRRINCIRRFRIGPQRIGFDSISPTLLALSHSGILFGEQGHPVRTTVTEMGPLLLSRLMDLERGAGRYSEHRVPCGR